MCIDMCVDMCVDICVGVCIDVCSDAISFGPAAHPSITNANTQGISKGCLLPASQALLEQHSSHGYAIFKSWLQLSAVCADSTQASTNG